MRGEEKVKTKHYCYMDAEGFEPSTSRMQSVRATTVPSAHKKLSLTPNISTHLGANANSTCDFTLFSLTLVRTGTQAEYAMFNNVPREQDPLQVYRFLDHSKGMMVRV